MLTRTSIWTIVIFRKTTASKWFWMTLFPAIWRWHIGEMTLAGSKTIAVGGLYASFTIVEFNLNPSFYYYMEDLFHFYTYLNSHDNGMHLKDKTKWFMEFRFHHWVSSWELVHGTQVCGWVPYSYMGPWLRVELVGLIQLGG